MLKDLTILNFDSVDNSRVETSNNSSKLDLLISNINSVKDSIPAKLSGSGASGMLGSAISILEEANTSCKNISDLYDTIIELYKKSDYEASSEIMSAFNQSLLLYQLGFLSLEDLENLYLKTLYTYDESGNMVELDYDLLKGIYDSMPLTAAPLGDDLSGGFHIVLDPFNGSSTKVDDAFAFRLQAVVNVLGALGIHVPLGCGFNPNSENSFSKHRRGLAMDWDTGHAININYNEGSDTVTIRQYIDGEGSREVSESSSNVFYNTVSCSIDEWLKCPEGKSVPYERGLYAKIPNGVEIPEEYKKYVVTDLDNVIQSNNVLNGPGNENNVFVSIKGDFVDMNKLYEAAGMQQGVPGDTWPREWTNYEAHHVELITDDYSKIPKVYNSDGSILSDPEVSQCYEIAGVLESLK